MVWLDREVTVPDWLLKFLPILALLVSVGVVVSLLPKVDVGHAAAFKRRRTMNWVPLGLTYAFLYFGSPRTFIEVLMSTGTPVRSPNPAMRS